MGCEPSQVPTREGAQIKINIVDSGFMKLQNQNIRKQMEKQNISYQCFISLQCFFDQFSKRYYNKIVTSYQNYRQLRKQLNQTGLTPNIYVILNGHKLEQSMSFNSVAIQSYAQLIQYLKNQQSNNIASNSLAHSKIIKKHINVKILCKPGPKTSDQQIFMTALQKFGITYQFFNSYQMLQQSILESQADFIVTDYIFHKQIVELFNGTRSKIYCYCGFENNQTYAPQVFSLSNSYLDIANDIKSSLKMGSKGVVKCSKVYMYTNNLQDSQQVKNILQNFDIQVRPFSNLEKVIKQTTYFFCVTVVTAECQAKNVAKFLQRNDYLDRIKILTIPNNIDTSIKGLYKLIRNIKKGYYAQKSITNSIDIIDKHYNNVKFQQIKKQLQSNQIKCFGYASLNQYIKNKKFISPFIICNYQQRILLMKYLKQLQSKAKIIIFCNKNKINPELKDNPSFSYVSSHFGKIIKFIRKTLVYLPVLDRQQQLVFKQKLDKLRNKNKRISAIKWSQLQIKNEVADSMQDNFQFLNISKETNQDSIRDIQKSVSTIWKADSSISQLQNFRSQFIKSLGELKKLNKINFSQHQFNQLIQKLKVSTISQLLEKVKTFFDADNQLGLEINKSLMKTESLQKKQITNMKQFVLLVFINFFSGYQIPRIGRKKVFHWISNNLIEKCEIGSYLFCKHFLVFYDNSSQNLSALGKYKIQLQIQYNLLVQSDLLLNSFINYKDKLIFSPFSQFQIQKIQNAGQFKVITVKFIKNIDFLKYIFQDNIFKPGENAKTFASNIIKNNDELIDANIKQSFIENIERIKAIEKFQQGYISQAIETHKKLIKSNEQKQNLDSFLVNQLNFQLACFYFKADKNRQAGATIKELLESDPGEFIKEQCQKIIKQVTQSDEMEQRKGRRVSEQAMKTFVWLKNKQRSQGQSICSSQEQQQGFVKQQQIAKMHRGMKCMEIDDLDEMEEFPQKDLGKQNVQ